MNGKRVYCYGVTSFDKKNLRNSVSIFFNLRRLILRGLHEILIQLMLIIAQLHTLTN